jgi:hypothetical protein
MNFTHNNHLYYTIGDRLFGHREEPTEKYVVNVGKIDKSYYKTSTWQQEQIRTADLIYQDYGKDFAVMFSGGTDSEIVLRSFKKIGVKPRVVFIKFKGQYNLSDLNVARHIAQELDFELEEQEFDIIDFYNSGQAYEFAGEIQCRQMAYLTVYHHIKQMQMPAVMGGEMLMRRHVTLNSSKWYYVIRENEDASAMRFSLKYNIPLVNEWFSYTPEMLAYYLERPEIKWLINQRDNGKLGSVTIKNRVLSALLPELIPKRKTHGFEKLMGFNGESYEELYKSHVKRLEPSLDGIFIEDLVKQLYGD